MPKTSRPRGSRRGAGRDPCRCVMTVPMPSVGTSRSFRRSNPSPIARRDALYARLVRDPTTSRLAAFGTTIFSRMSTSKPAITESTMMSGYTKLSNKIAITR